MTLLLLSIFIASITCTLAGSHFIRAPSVFRSEDAEMHKYAAILAATEPFKASCVRQIMQSVGPLRRIAYLIGGMDYLLWKRVNSPLTLRLYKF